MLPLVSLALGLAEVVPSIVGWLKGDKAEQRAEQIVGLAKHVAGVDDPVKAIDAIKAYPGLVMEFQEAMSKLELEFFREETKRMEIINQTMRVEYESKDRFKTGWRPFIGWVLGCSLGFYIFTMCVVFMWVVVTNINQATQVLQAIAALASALTPTWTVCMVVLGVAVKKRSDDKLAAIGQVKPGLIEKLAGIFKK